MTWEFGKGGKVVSWEGGKDGRVVRWQGGRGGRVVRWQVRKGRRVVIWQGWEGGRVAEWQGGRVLVCGLTYSEPELRRGSPRSFPRRGGCEFDGPMETAQYMWMNIWCMVHARLDCWILSQNCRNTLPRHMVA